MEIWTLKFHIPTEISRGSGRWLQCGVRKHEGRQRVHPRHRLSAHMNIHNLSPTPAVATVQPVNQPQLKLALDVHVQSIVVAAMADALLKPVRRFRPADFLSWVQSQQAAGWAIVSCYEASSSSSLLSLFRKSNSSWTIRRMGGSSGTTCSPRWNISAALPFITS